MEIFFELTENVSIFYIMGFSLWSGMEFFAAPKNGIPLHIQPPAMRVRVDCYTKKLPFGLQ